MMIDDEAAARRLAKAICADIALYNAVAQDASPAERARVLSAPIAEGRELFATRVAPHLVRLYDVEVTASLSVGSAMSPRVEAGPQIVGESEGKGGLPIAFALIAAAIAGAWFLFAR